MCLGPLPFAGLRACLSFWSTVADTDTASFCHPPPASIDLVLPQ